MRKDIAGICEARREEIRNVESLGTVLCRGRKADLGMRKPLIMGIG